MSSKRDAETIDDLLRKFPLLGAKELIAGLDRLKQLYEQNPGMDPTDDTPESRKRWSDLAFRFARAELEHAEALLDVSHRQAELIFDHARRLIAKSKSKSEGGGSSKRVLDLVERREHYEGHFTIENPFSSPADFRCSAVHFQSASGQTVEFKGFLAVTKPKIVPANADADVYVTIPLSATEGRPHGTYFADLEAFLAADVEQSVAHRILRLRIG